MSNTNFSKGVSQPSFYSDGVVIEKDGSFRPSPLIYIPSNSYRFERLLSIYNASLDGTTDDAVAFQNALNALPTNKVNDIRIPEGVSSIKFNSGITFNVTYAYLRGMGVMFDFSGMTSGQAWTNIGGGTDNTYNQVMGGVERVKFYGPGRYTNVDGIISTGGSTASPNIGSARSGIYCSSVYNFRIGKIWFNRGYLTRLHDCEVHSNLLGYYSKGGAYDAYENVAAIGGAVYNNDMNIYVEDGYLTLNGTSIDYAEFVQIAIRAGFLQLDSCHIEYSIQNSNYGNAGAIYSNNAPMCAFDMQPGGTSALRTDIGLTSTTVSSGQNWAAIKMNGGVWAVTPPRSGSVIDVDALSCHVNQAGNAQFTLTGNPKLLFNGYGTKSGYICHNLSTYNTVGNYTSPVEWDGGFWDGSSDVPNLIVDNVSTYLSSNKTQGLSISPSYNLLGSYGITGSSGVYSFENDGEYSENVTIVEDSLGTTTAVLPTNRLIGSAGSVSSLATFSHTGTKSLKITKTASAGQPFKVAIDVPINSNSLRRKVFRGVIGAPTTTGATTGSMNVNLAYIRDDMARVSDTGTVYTMTSNEYLVTGGVATSGSSAASHSSSVFKATSGSLYGDLTTFTLGNWYAFQFNQKPNTYVPAWARILRIEIDLKNMGPGDICFDSLDLQPL